MTADTNQTLNTTESGGNTGTTSTAKGAPQVRLTADNTSTSEAFWTYDRVEPYTRPALVSVHVNQAGEHTHSAHFSGSTMSAEQYIEGPGTYYHSHSIQDTNVTVDENGGHRHSAESDEHYHDISKRSLQHYHNVSVENTSNIEGYQGFDHTHNFSVPGHSHQLKIAHQHKVTIPSQTVSIPCPRHTHQLTIPGWSKTISIPPHTHGISAGIFESGNATAFDIYVGNTKKATVSATYYDGDITQWLLNNKNQVPRDQWIDIEIRPNDLAYVVSSVFVQGFVQSRGGGNY